MVETDRGHYGVQLFRGIRECIEEQGREPREISQDCLVSQKAGGAGSRTHVSFDIDQLEATSTSSPAAVQDQEQSRAPPQLLPQAVYDADREGSEKYRGTTAEELVGGTDGTSALTSRKMHACPRWTGGS